jgi:hypothetical protein
VVPADARQKKPSTAPQSGSRLRAPLPMLRVDGVDFPLNGSRLKIGRSTSSDIPLDGTAVSRQHAAITMRERTLVLEDLGSRNGVFVNGVLIVQPLPLENGDRIRIGEHEIEVVTPGPTGVALHTASADGEDADPATARGDPLEVLGGIVDGALDAGDAEEAEALIAGHLRALLHEAQCGRPLAPASLIAATHYALRIAEVTQRGEWVDYVFDLHLCARRLLPATAIRELFRLASCTRYQDRKILRRYLEFVASQGLALGADTPAVLERLARYGRI